LPLLPEFKEAMKRDMLQRREKFILAHHLAETWKNRIKMEYSISNSKQMSTEVEKHCLRCGAAFVCKTGDIKNCQCSTVELSDETKIFLAKTNFDCLCNKCLMEFNKLVKEFRDESLPPPEAMVEDVHFYVENQCLVFTEFYHILRGYCCESGCRHCPYGFKYN